MKSKLYLLSIIAVFASTSCTNMYRKVPVSFQAGKASPQVESSQTKEIYKAVNSYRAAKNLPELQQHAGLERFARRHCEYLREHRGTFSLYGKNVSHIGSDARSLIAIKRFGMLNCSENVAWMKKRGSEAKSGSMLVQMWSDSPNHDWTMSGKSWTHTGIASVVDEDGSVFATQLFCTINVTRLSQEELFNRF